MNPSGKIRGNKFRGGGGRLGERLVTTTTLG